jgi:hypothetical protein
MVEHTTGQAIDLIRSAGVMMHEYKVPEHLGESARQFEWLQNETQALAAVVRGFGNIVENARAMDPGASPSPKEPQRLSYTRKGKKRKTKKR